MVKSKGKITDSDPGSNQLLLNGLADEEEKNQDTVSCCLKTSVCVDRS